MTPAWHEKWAAARRKGGYSSAKALAKKAGVSERTAIRWEKGDARPKDDIRPTLRALGPSFAKLVDQLPNQQRSDRPSLILRRLAALEADRELRADQIAQTLERLEAQQELFDSRLAKLESELRARLAAPSSEA